MQLTARVLDGRIEQAMDEREQWRVYLVAYAAALAVGLSYLFFRLSTRLAAARRETDRLAVRIAEQQAALDHAHVEQERIGTQLVAMGRYWSIGQLTAGISREITRPLAAARTHLSTIRTALPDLRGSHDQARRLVDLLRSTQCDPREVDKAVSVLANHLEHLQRNNAIDDIDALAWGGLRDVEHVAELMAQVRGFFRPDAPGCASFNVNDAVQAALLIATPLLQALHVDKALGDIPAIACRPAEMIQLMLSLVARAAQSSQHPGGHMRIATRPLADGIAVDVWSKGEPGQDDGDLAIARQIVARHAGGIAVRPSADGTLVAVELPHGTGRVAATG
jgi:signal transduction histidine kinase